MDKKKVISYLDKITGVKWEEWSEYDMSYDDSIYTRNKPYLIEKLKELGIEYEIVTFEERIKVYTEHFSISSIRNYVIDKILTE